MTLHLLHARKFKTNVITVLLRTELTEENAVNNAMLAGILRLGCEKFPTEAEISRECEEMYGAALEINVVKKGEEHLIQLYIEVIKYEELFERAGSLIGSLLFEPLTDGGGFCGEYFELQKSRVREAIAGRINDKRKYALERCAEIMCENERFGVPAEGRAETLDRLTPQSVYGYYLRMITESAIEVCVIGDIEEDACIKWASRYFARSRVEIKRYKPAVIICGKRALKEVREKMNVAQGKLVIGARCGAASVGVDFYRLLVFNEILGGGANSRFFKNIREKHSLCYYVHSFLYRAKSIMIIQAGIDGNDYEKTLELIAAQIEEARDGGVTQDELENAKKTLITRTQTLTDSPQELTEFFMTNALLGDGAEVSDVRGFIESVTAQDARRSAAGINLDTAFFLEGI